MRATVLAAVLAAVGVAAVGVAAVGVAVTAAPVPKGVAKPREKTTAELLVGTWVMTHFDGRPVPEGYRIMTTFTADGQVTSDVPERGGRRRATMGKI